MCINMSKTIKEERLRWVLPIVRNEIRLVDVYRKHKCHNCKKILYKDDKRIETDFQKFCLRCGLKFGEEKIKEWVFLVKEIRKKYTKLIVAERLGVESENKR